MEFTSFFAFTLELTALTATIEMRNVSMTVITDTISRLAGPKTFISNWRNFFFSIGFNTPVYGRWHGTGIGYKRCEARSPSQFPVIFIDRTGTFSTLSY